MVKAHYETLGEAIINFNDPIFNTPHNWTHADMKLWFSKHEVQYKMGWPGRCMALSHHMKTYTPDNDPILNENPR